MDGEYVTRNGGVYVGFVENTVEFVREDVEYVGVYGKLSNSPGFSESPVNSPSSWFGILVR